MFVQVGNICSILATKDPSVGLSIAYPVMQCGLAVAGLWGICLFGEMRNGGQVCCAHLAMLICALIQLIRMTIGRFNASKRPGISVGLPPLVMTADLKVGSVHPSSMHGSHDY